MSASLLRCRAIQVAQNRFVQHSKIPLKGFRVIVIPAVNQLLRFNHYAAVHGSGWPHQSCCFRDKSNFSYHIIGRCLGWL